jgi:glycosyltransferase involved in cell wall biosynthesis
LSDLRGGGAERVVVNLLNHWPSDKFRPILLLAEQRGPYLQDLDPGIEVLCCGFPLTAVNTPKSLLRLRTLLKRVQPAAIFSHSITTSRMLTRARALGVISAPLIPVLHNNVGRSHQSRKSLSDRIIRRELEWLYSKASRIVAVSKGIADEAREFFRIPQEKLETIYNPIDLPKIAAMAERDPNDHFVEAFKRLKRPIILSVGRLSEQKNHSLLLEAYARLPTSLRGSLLVLGEGDRREALEATTRALGISKEVFMPGFVPNPWWYMKHSELYVMSSNWEGYPMVLLEALACGAPVVATDCEHGPSEIIRGEAFGTLVPVGNAQALATAIAERLACGKPQAKAEVREFLSNYLPGLVAQRYFEAVGRSRW